MSCSPTSFGGAGTATSLLALSQVLTRCIRPENYLSVAEQLLEVLGANGKPGRLEEIRFMSEPLDAALELRLAQEWGVSTTDMYSANETG